MAERLARYEYHALGKVLRRRLDADPRGWREIAREIGVTSSDLSRIAAGQAVSAAKVYAVCDWLGVHDRQFYRPVKRAAGECFTGKALKQPISDHGEGSRP